MLEAPFRQIFYHSRAVECCDAGDIVAVSKRNNGMDGISGVLFFDGEAFLQVLEGPQSSVDATFQRILADPRHTDVRIISDHPVDERDFAYWSMELLEPGQSSDAVAWRLRRRLEDFSPDLHHHFFDRTSFS